MASTHWTDKRVPLLVADNGGFRKVRTSNGSGSAETRAPARAGWGELDRHQESYTIYSSFATATTDILDHVVGCKSFFYCLSHGNSLSRTISLGWLELGRAA